MGGTIVKIKDVAEKAEKSMPPLALELLSMWAIAQACLPLGMALTP
jgi:hypothetical protein